MNKEFYMDKYYKLEELKIKANIERHIVQRGKGIWKNIVIFGFIITIILKLTDLRLFDGDILKFLIIFDGSLFALIILYYLNRRLDGDTLGWAGNINKEVEDLKKLVKKWEDKEEKKEENSYEK